MAICSIKQIITSRMSWLNDSLSALRFAILVLLSLMSSPTLLARNSFTKRPPSDNRMLVYEVSTETTFLEYSLLLPHQKPHSRNGRYRSNFVYMALWILSSPTRLADIKEPDCPTVYFAYFSWQTLKISGVELWVFWGLCVLKIHAQMRLSYFCSIKL